GNPPPLLIGLEEVAERLQRLGGVLVLRPGGLLVDLSPILGPLATMRFSQFDRLHGKPPLQARLGHPRRVGTTATRDLWTTPDLPGEPPDVAAEGEVAEAGGGVDQEVGDDQGGGAAAELVEAAEEQAEGEVAEEAAEALVEVVGAAGEGAGPQGLGRGLSELVGGGRAGARGEGAGPPGLGRGPAEVVEGAQEVAADDLLFEQAAAGGGQEQDEDRP